MSHQLRSALGTPGLASALHGTTHRPLHTASKTCRWASSLLPLGLMPRHLPPPPPPSRSRRALSASAVAGKGSAAAAGGGGGEGANGKSVLASADEVPGWEEVQGAGRIVNYELHREASESYLAYAMSVIVGRALPDVRDGLKPVHRRILFAMHELGLASNKPFRKCARVVGEVLGKYHPHGDTAVYDALVRLAQDFSMRDPLVDGHGNFGSLDNDPAAAMRYTECRLRALSAESLLTDLESDTVDYVPNFDGSQNEPSVLPARIPHLLVNGSSGIAVGLATKIPPHNMAEVVDGLKALIRDPNITSGALRRFIPAPDFPTGGRLLDGAGLGDAYNAGRGSFILRGKVDIEAEGNGNATKGKGRKRAGDRLLIVITEIPYQTNKADLVEKIAELVDSRVIENVSDVRDESDREGMRVVVEVKRGGHPEMVLNQLYHHTRLQVRYSCNMVALVDGQPLTLGLKDFLREFLEWRCSVIQRRSSFQVARARNRLHLVEGYILILKDVDKAVKLIRAAPDSGTAASALADEFSLSPEQTKAVLNMTLGRLTNMEANKLAAEETELAGNIIDLEDLITSRDRLLSVVEAEADEVVKKFGTKRRTVVERDSGQGSLQTEDIVPNDSSFVTFSKLGYVKRMKASTFSVQRRGGVGVSGTNLRGEDSMAQVIEVMDHDHMLFFGDNGVVYSVRAFDIPEAKRQAQGAPITSVLGIPKSARITAIVSVSNFEDKDRALIMATKDGLIKKVKMADFANIRANGLIAIKLRDDDSLDFVEASDPGSSVLIASNTGRMINISEAILRPTSRTAMGVKSMKLLQDEMVMGMSILPPEVAVETHAGDSGDLDSDEDEAADEDPKNSAPWVFMVTRKGFGKRVGVRHFRQQSRGGMGVRGMKLRSGDSLASMHVVGLPSGALDDSPGETLIASVQGQVQRNPLAGVSLQSRSAMGVLLMRLKDGDEVISAMPIAADSAADEAFP